MVLQPRRLQLDNPVIFRLHLKICTCSFSLLSSLHVVMLPCFIRIKFHENWSVIIDNIGVCS
jgi:hypothetical protein